MPISARAKLFVLSDLSHLARTAHRTLERNCLFREKTFTIGVDPGNSSNLIYFQCFTSPPAATTLLRDSIRFTTLNTQRIKAKTNTQLISSSLSITPEGGLSNPSTSLTRTKTLLACQTAHCIPLASAYFAPRPESMTFAVSNSTTKSRMIERCLI
jgi:hypothetical protein